MATIKCGEATYHSGKNSQQVQKDCDEDTCTAEEQCKDGEKKGRCLKRSMVGPSKEDPNFWIGFVACLCPKDLDQDHAYPLPLESSTFACGSDMYFYGKDKERVEKTCGEIVCTQAKQCKDGEERRHCTKRSLVKGSKEDPKLYLGFVRCFCPQNLELD